jgi:hypothetical protein
MEDGQLQPVNISNKAEDECQLVIDTNSDSFFTFPFLFPFFLVMATIIGSLFLPQKSLRLSVPGTFYHRTALGSIGHLSSWSDVLSATLRVDNATSISGIVNVTCLRQNQPFLQITSPIPPSNGSSVTLFRHSLLDFDSVNVSVTLDSSLKWRQYTLDWEFANSAWSMALAVLRILLSAPFLPYLFLGVTQFIGSGTHEISLERKLTNLLSLATVLFVDPFFDLQLFKPSAARYLCHVALRDVYLSYVVFHLVALFGHFTPNDGIALNYGFPTVLGAITLTGLLLQDFWIKRFDGLVLLPGDAGHFDRFEIGHFFVLSILAVVLIARAAIETEGQRHKWYTAAAIGFAVILAGLIGAEVFFGAAQEVVTMAVVSSFGLLMEYLHTETDEEPYGEYDQKEGAVGGGELGADEDSDKVGDTVKKAAEATQPL